MAMSVSRKDFKMVKVPDTRPDLSYLGEYSDTPGPNAIDRKERGDMRRGEFRYFNPAMSGEETGNPDSPEQGYQRAEAFNRGEWGMIGIQAEVQLKIPSKQGGYWTLQTIKSPGLWGIEDDGDEDHFEEVYREECDHLTEMLEQMGITVRIR